MKKIYLIFFITFFFCFLSSASAVTNRCPLADTSKWDYLTSRTSTSNVSTLPEEETNEKVVCCVPDEESEIWWCDRYQKKEEKEEKPKEEEQVTSTTTDYSGLRSTFTLIGQIVRLAKILIPIIIIAYGAYDFFKAVTAQKDDEIKKSTRSLLFRCLAGVCIFFLPAVIDLVFGWVDGWNENYNSFYQECFKCIWNVESCK